MLVYHSERNIMNKFILVKKTCDCDDCETEIFQLSSENIDDATNEAYNLLVHLDEKWKEKYLLWKNQDRKEVLNYFDNTLYNSGLYLLSDHDCEIIIMNVVEEKNISNIFKEKYEELMDFRRDIFKDDLEKQEFELYEKLKKKFERIQSVQFPDDVKDVVTNKGKGYDKIGKVI